jgi:nitrate/nitrite transporter NarK
LTGTLAIPAAPPEAKAPEQMLSGFVPPSLVAAVSERAGKGDAAMWIIAGAAFVSGLLVALLFRRRRAAPLLPLPRLASC